MDNYFEKLAMFNKCVAEDSFKNFSDGHHTFEELYYHRMILFAVIVNEHKDISWKSKQHHDPDDEMFEGDFIVGIDTPAGQATYHYKLEYWDLFDVTCLERAPEWDGHTPDEAIKRITSLIKKDE